VLVGPDQHVVNIGVSHVPLLACPCGQAGRRIAAKSRSGTRADRSPVRALREGRSASRLPVDALMHAVPNEFMELEPSAVTAGPSASEQHPVGKLRRWGDGVGTPSGDSTTDHNRPGANPPQTYVDVVPRKSRSPERVMPARTSAQTAAD
jgi:hypothetical protein